MEFRCVLFRSVAEGPRGPPLRDAARGARRALARSARATRPRRRDLRLRPSLPVARRGELRPRRPRRGAGGEEPGGAADARGEGAPPPAPAPPPPSPPPPTP